MAETIPMGLIPLEEPAARCDATQKSGNAFLALGFRPFYALAALFSALAVPIWVLVLNDRVSLPLPGMLWHAHEMLYGVVVAVMVGFLLTAGRNWTGLPTPSGRGLAALVLLWLAGRLAMGFSAGVASGVIDVAFLPVAAVALGRVLWQARSARNYFIVVLLLLLTGANVLFHLAHLGRLALDPLLPLHLALSLVVVLETVIAGRVIPGFTASALRGVVVKQRPALDRAAIGVGAVALLLWALAGELPSVVATAIGAPLALVAAGCHLVRWLGWNTWETRKTPLLWSLHVAYLWVPLGLLLLAAAQWGFVSRSAGVHALAIGATGGLIMGMITRTALGHTGRLLIASGVETTAYGLVQLAAVARVLTLLAVPAAAMVGVYVAALAWSLAFALYLVRYLPFLWRPRIDGRPG